MIKIPLDLILLEGKIKGDLAWEIEVKENLDTDEYTKGYTDGRIEILEEYLQTVTNWIRINTRKVSQ